jgi:hypothetical protein
VHEWARSIPNSVRNRSLCPIMLMCWYLALPCIFGVRNFHG